MRYLTRSLIGLALLSLTLGLLGYGALTLRGAMEERAARDGTAQGGRERVYAAPVERITPQSLSPQLVAYGEVRSLRELELRAPEAGTVIETHPAFRDGRTIRAGEVILKLDASEAETEVATASADLQDAQNELDDAIRDLSLASDERAAAEAQSALRGQALARQMDLLERGVGSAVAVETAQLNEAASTQTVFSRRQAEAVAEARIEQAETSLARRQIALQEARRRLSETVLIAPFDGAFSDVTAEQGARVAQNETLGTLIDPLALEVRFRVTSAQYLRLLDEAGGLRPAGVLVELDAQNMQIRTEAELTGAAARVEDGQTGRELYATLAQARGFQPGDFVTVIVQEPALDGVARLPAAALTVDGSVMVVGPEDRLEPVAVTLLRRQGEFVVIDAEPLAGRDVVTQLTPVLGAGIKVRPVRPLQETAAVQPTPRTMVTLDAARRAELVALVEASAQLERPAKDRLLARLSAESVPADLIERIETRPGG